MAFDTNQGIPTRAMEEEAWRRAGYSWLPRGLSLAGVYDYFRRDWRGASRHVVEAARQDPGAFGSALVYHAGRILLVNGDPVGARPFVEALLPARPEDPIPLNHSLMVLTHALRAELYLALGDAARARSWLEAAQRWPAMAVAPAVWLSALTAAAAAPRPAMSVRVAWGMQPVRQGGEKRCPQSASWANSKVFSLAPLMPPARPWGCGRVTPLDRCVDAGRHPDPARHPDRRHEQVLRCHEQVFKGH